MTYLKKWVGRTVSTGIGMGDNGGYPVDRYREINTIEELVDTYDSNAEYFKMVPVDVSAVVGVIQAFQEEGGGKDVPF